MEIPVPAWDSVENAAPPAATYLRVPNSMTPMKSNLPKVVSKGKANTYKVRAGEKVEEKLGNFKARDQPVVDAAFAHPKLSKKQRKALARQESRKDANAKTEGRHDLVPKAPTAVKKEKALRTGLVEDRNDLRSPKSPTIQKKDKRPRTESVDQQSEPAPPKRAKIAPAAETRLPSRSLVPEVTAPIHADDKQHNEKQGKKARKDKKAALRDAYLSASRKQQQVQQLQQPQQPQQQQQQQRQQQPRQQQQQQQQRKHEKQPQQPYKMPQQNQKQKQQKQQQQQEAEEESEEDARFPLHGAVKDLTADPTRIMSPFQVCVCVCARARACVSSWDRPS
jgi:hypothetical protein